jgi:hypothetical protein
VPLVQLLVQACQCRRDQPSALKNARDNTQTSTQSGPPSAVVVRRTMSAMSSGSNSGCLYAAHRQRNVSMSIPARPVSAASPPTRNK